MKPVIMALPLILALPGTGSAALSGFYDTGQKVAAIFSTPEVADALRQMPVEGMRRTGSGPDGGEAWELQSGDCLLGLQLIPVAPDGPGMTTWQVRIATPCK